MTTETVISLSELEKLLSESARAENKRQFFALVEGVDWATRSPAELAKAIDLALSLEMSSSSARIY
jgi:transposase